ncbi:hypothetical protein [Winogradskyella poriferorum]|uniref:DUF4230 domain-containing protein n=1 Tax=Winogradskyella poriferorum TaxID=307627 RepID=A0ABU7W2J1_9FLAO
MSFLYFLIAVVAVIIIFKFIYDSYLTNNTERRWQEFKKVDPNWASRIENSKFGRKKVNIKNEENSIFQGIKITDKETALNILKGKRVLEIGLNKNVDIFRISHTKSEYILYLDAMTQKEIHLAKELFKQEEYDIAINQIANLIIEEKQAKFLEDKIKVDIILEEGGDINKISLKIQPEISDDLEINFDAIFYYDFTDLYKLLFFKTEYVRMNNLRPVPKVELELIQEGLERYILFFQSKLGELEDKLFEDPKKGLRLFQDELREDLIQLIEYDFHYNVDDSYISAQINKLNDRFFSLEKLFPIDKDNPF